MSSRVKLTRAARPEVAVRSTARNELSAGSRSVAWGSDGTGFFYTRYPRAGERPEADLDFFQQVWFHKLGTPESKDAYVIGKDFPRIAETELERSEDGKYVLVHVANGDGGDFEQTLVGIERVFYRDGVLYSQQGQRWLCGGWKLKLTMFSPPRMMMSLTKLRC